MLLVIFVVLLVLKVLGLVTFSWWIVFLPVLIIPMFYLTVWCFTIVAVVIGAMFSPISTLRQRRSQYYKK